jgi:Recombination endonuclease VII
MISWNEKQRRRYAEDPEYRKKELESASRYYATHKAEITERKRRRYATDPEYRTRVLAQNAKSQRANLLKRYGMSLPEYELRLARQNGVCAICRKNPKGLLCVDHCHVTGKVRGLLCRKCNTALGFYDDDPIRMQAGADYLRTFYESLEPRGDVMTSTHDHTETGKASRLMREAILVELRCEPGQADDGAADNLRLIARKLVAKAADGDIQAIKEVLDRIDGKSVPGPDDAAQGPRQVSIRWKDAAASSRRERT